MEAMWNCLKQVLYQNFMVFDRIMIIYPIQLYKYMHTFYGHQMFRHACAMVHDI